MSYYFNLYEDWETGLKKIGGLQHETMHDALRAAKNARSKHLSIIVIDPETLTIRTVWRPRPPLTGSLSPARSALLREVLDA